MDILKIQLSIIGKFLAGKAFGAIVAFIFLNTLLFAQTSGQCDNLGFASGDFVDWNFSAGCHPNAVVNPGLGPCHDNPANDGCCNTPVQIYGTDNAPNNDILAKHTRFNAGNDQYGDFSLVPPQLAGFRKSNYSIRLGNAVAGRNIMNPAGGQADRFERTFQITEDNAIFAYHFAFVLNDPGTPIHYGEEVGNQQFPEAGTEPYLGLPFFEATLIRGNGSDSIPDTIPCSSLLVLADDKSFDSIPEDGEYIRFKDWSPVILNLTKYLGETVTLRFTNADCALGGHWGYSYVSAYCGAYEPMQDVSVCVNDTVTLTSPFPIEGFDLLWSTGETTETIKVIADKAQTITLTVKNKVPIGKMDVCEDVYTVNITIGEIPPPTLENDTICTGGSVVLKAQPQGFDYDWYTESTGGTPVYVGDTYELTNITTNLKFYVKSTGDCASDERTLVEVIIFDLVADAGPDKSICLGDSAQLNASGGDIYSWTPPLGLSNVNIANPKASPPATTTYTVTVQDQAGLCEDTDVVIVKVEEIEAKFEGTDVCVGFVTDFTNLTTPIDLTGADWLWDFSDGNTSSSKEPSHTYATVGTYKVLLSVNAGTCSDTFSTSVNVHPNPVAAFTPAPKKATADDPVITFTDQSVGAATGTWNFGDGGIEDYFPLEDKIHRYYATNEDEGPFKYTITLSVESEYGCKDEVSHPIEIENIWSLFVPNSFTPDGDGINDYFKAYGIGILEFKMTIFNRWGEAVYRGDNIDEGWDGSPINGSRLKQDLYVWKVKAVNNKGKTIKLVGHVSLLPGARN